MLGQVRRQLCIGHFRRLFVSVRLAPAAALPGLPALPLYLAEEEVGGGVLFQGFDPARQGGSFAVYLTRDLAVYQLGPGQEVRKDGTDGGVVAGTGSGQLCVCYKLRRQGLCGHGAEEPML